MREAVGSTYLFQIVIVFIFFFAAFLAVAINYSQAFQIKNQVVNALEQAEGYNATSKERIKTIKASNGYFRDVNQAQCRANLGADAIVPTDSDTGAPLNGICILRHDNGDGKAYYTVQTYVWFDLPIIGNFITIPVNGETKLIVNDNYDL